jgi:hypothetical protein
VDATRAPVGSVVKVDAPHVPHNRGKVAAVAVVVNDEAHRPCQALLLGAQDVVVREHQVEGCLRVQGRQVNLVNEHAVGGAQPRARKQHAGLAPNGKISARHVEHRQVKGAMRRRGRRRGGVRRRGLLPRLRLQLLLLLLLRI